MANTYYEREIFKTTFLRELKKWIVAALDTKVDKSSIGTNNDPNSGNTNQDNPGGSGNNNDPNSGNTDPGSNNNENNNPSVSTGEENKIEKIYLNNIEQAIDENKAVHLNVITSTVNNLMNYYLKEETYSAEEIDGFLNNLASLNMDLVENLPSENISTNTIYLKENENDSTIKEQYIYNIVKHEWINIGDTSIHVEQSDWNQTDSTAIDYIKNKPNIQTLIANLQAQINTLTESLNNISNTNSSSGQNESISLEDLDIDKVPVKNSTNLVESGGVYSELTKKINTTSITNKIEANNSNPISSKGIYLALQDYIKINSLDNKPKQDSKNPVKSSGIYNELQSLDNRITILEEGATSGNEGGSEGPGGNETGSSTPNYQIDNFPTENSTNLVQSGGVYTALQEKQNTLTYDDIPTQDSQKHVKSGGIYTYINNLIAELQNSGGGGDSETTPSWTFDDTPQENSNNPVKSNGIYTALQGKQNTLVLDDVPTADSDNFLTSGVIYTALLTKQDAGSGNSSGGSSSESGSGNNSEAPSLTFDDYPEENSSNPVKSSGIYQKLLELNGNIEKIKSSFTIFGEILDDLDAIDIDSVTIFENKKIFHCIRKCRFQVISNCGENNNSTYYVNDLGPEYDITNDNIIHNYSISDRSYVSESLKNINNSVPQSWPGFIGMYIANEAIFKTKESNEECNPKITLHFTKTPGNYAPIEYYAYKHPSMADAPNFILYRLTNNSEVVLSGNYPYSECFRIDLIQFALDNTDLNIPVDPLTVIIDENGVIGKVNGKTYDLSSYSTVGDIKLYGGSKVRDGNPEGAHLYMQAFGVRDSGIPYNTLYSISIETSHSYDVEQTISTIKSTYQPRIMDTPVTINGEEKTTVQGAIQALTTAVNNLLQS